MMNGEYVVRFSELRKDTETFEFSLKEKFFQVFTSTEWESGHIKVIVGIEKRSDGLTIHLDMRGELTVVCDRCLEAFPHPVDTQQSLYVKYGIEEQELDDNVVVVSRDENQVDLGKYMYEYLVLALPVRRIHPELKSGKAGCNPEMLEKLERHIVKDEAERIDPRWEELRKLMDKN